MMDTKLSVNGRFLQNKITGVQRYAREICNLSNWQVAAPPSHCSRAFGNLWEQFVLPCKVKGLLWSPANIGPLFFRNHLVTIHDAAVLRHPEWFSASFHSWYSFAWPQLAERALAILTVSEFSRSELVETLKIKPEHIGVVPNGGDHMMNITSSRPSFAETLCVPFVLSVGSLQPRKNLSRLVSAWKRLNRSDRKLVLVGECDPVFADTDLQADASIVFTGRISDSELSWCYKEAQGFIAPSLYEGFGIPSLEALFCGCPVLVSNIPINKEVIGSAGRYFDPLVESDIAEAIEIAFVQGRTFDASQFLTRQAILEKYTWSNAYKAMSLEVNRRQ